MIFFKMNCLLNFHIKNNERTPIAMDLNKLSYYKTGGPCEKLYAPKNNEELEAALTSIAGKKIPYFLLGAGTNSLVMDTPFAGAVISFHKMTSIKLLDQKIICGAGVSNTQIAELALEQGLAGAAWMNYLPGQIGATVRMNARCYGGEISQIVTGIRAYTPQGKPHTYQINSQDRSVFRAYKDTIFMTNQEIIAEVELRLQPGDSQAIKERMDYCRNDREAKSQFTFPSCGCVFKNDYAPEVSISSGMLLEFAGAKDLVKERCRVSQGHANFIFNTNNATSRDILELSIEMRNLVWEEFGVWLEYEMEILGTIPPDLQKQLVQNKVPSYRTERLDELRRIFNEKIKL